MSQSDTFRGGRWYIGGVWCSAGRALSRLSRVMSRPRAFRYLECLAARGGQA